jgi:hypothetical protein
VIQPCPWQRNTGLVPSSPSTSASTSNVMGILCEKYCNEPAVLPDPYCYGRIVVFLNRKF